MSAKPRWAAFRALAGAWLLAIASCGGGGSGGGGGNEPDPLVLGVGLADGVVGQPYQSQFGSSGGTGAHSFTLSGTLPDGLDFDGVIGAISGTPAGPAGETEITVTVTDSGTPAQTDSRDFLLRIADPLAADPGTPPLATIGVAYSHSIALSGGTPPYLFEGELPSGLTIGDDGEISGTPTANARSAAEGLVVRDSAAPPQQVDVDARVRVELEVATGALPDAFGGVGYDAQLRSRGGLPGFNWSQTGGALPFSVQAGGSVSGTAIATCAAADYSFDVSVTDSDSPAQSAQRSGITLSVVPRAVSIPQSSAPPVATPDQFYSFFVSVEPGVPPYAFTITSGALPPGIALDAASGSLSGTPNTGGTFTFTVQVTDDCGATDSRAFSLIVRSEPTGRNDSIATATPIGNGPFHASISPSGHPGTVFEPDQDYYAVTTTAASTITLDLAAISGEVDTVVEVVNAAGNRLQTCGAPAYTGECMNDDRSPGNLDSLLELRVNGPTTFYIHVVEWRGDGRPDLRYSLSVSGVN